MSEDTHPSNHPPFPPTTEDDRISWLRLLRSRRVGPATFYRLMSENETAAQALDALPELAKRAGAQGYAPCSVAAVEAEMSAGRLAGARLIFIGEPAYPTALAQIPDAPPAIWAVGDISVLSRPIVAMVGARNASSLGMRMAKGLARDLGNAGYVIASGLARGIDTAAHTATLSSGTIAVMAGGVDVLYPSENAGLGQDIERTGLRLSEQPIGKVPQARHFPSRNRIISGLAQAVIVIEAAAKSGSLITARMGLEQGRDVLAVPGHPLDPRAAGCNILIRDGAPLIRGTDDVLEMLQMLPFEPRREVPKAAAKENTTPSEPLLENRRSLGETAQLHQEILNRLGPTPLAEDQLIRDLRIGSKDAAPTLMHLELEGKILRHPGGLLSRSA